MSVVSGHIRGKTTTLPLQVEILYNEYDFTGAFAVASLLALLALSTLALKVMLEWEAAPNDLRPAAEAFGNAYPNRTRSRRFGEFVALDRVS